MKTLHPYQQEGVTWLKHTKRAILGDEMGIGKTLQSIVAAKELTNGAVVVCLASGKISTWAREIAGVDNEASILVVQSGGQVDQYATGQGSHWVVINYDLLDKRLEEVRDLYPNYETVIVDESHYIKEASAIRSKATVKLCEQAENIILLTGTPLMNRPMELFNQLKAIKHPLGDNWYSYARKYCGAYYRVIKRRVQNPRTGQWELKEIKFLETGGASNLDDLRNKMSTIYLRRTKDILGDQLPEKVVEIVETELDKEHKKQYEEAWDKYLADLERILEADEEVTEGQANQKLIKAQMAKHLTEMQKLKQIASQSKIDRVISDVENIVEQGEKVIIFTQYTKTLQDIKSGLLKKKIETVSLSGEDNEQARTKAIDAFQQGTAKVFVGNIKAAGTGINLFASSTVLFVDMEWTPALHDQAESRAHRYGQKKQVNVTYYVAKNTIDKLILEALEKKTELIKTVLEGGQKKTESSVQMQVLKKLSTHINRQKTYTQGII